MKNIFNIMSAASFAGVVFLISMTVYANMTRQARIDENREYIKSVIEKQVYQSIQLTMSPVTGKVNVGNKTPANDVADIILKMFFILLLSQNQS